MKNVFIALGMAAVLASCSGGQKKTIVAEEPQTLYQPREVTEKYASHFERLVTNVMVKEQSQAHVVYEYKDVRIDEVGLLASRFCSERGFDGAVLREAILHRNFSRRATFDCVALQ